MFSANLEQTVVLVCLTKFFTDPTGAPGQPGQPGRCECDPNEVENLNATIRSLEGKKSQKLLIKKLVDADFYG